ncbi:hypothetical protein HK405_000659 [Cladochytrium tenue]|nr:hypothetical protein HK405_000659 [Cladochytrium tenue]
MHYAVPLSNPHLRAQLTDADVAEVEAARRLLGLDEAFLHGPRVDALGGDELSTEAGWMRFGRDDLSIYREVYGYDGYVAGIRQIALAVLRDEELAASKDLAADAAQYSVDRVSHRVKVEDGLRCVAVGCDADRHYRRGVAPVRVELHEYSWAHSDWEEWPDIPLEFSTVCGGKAVIDFVTDGFKLVLRDPSTFGWIIRGRVETIKSVDNETGTVYSSGSCLLEAGAHVALR